MVIKEVTVQDAGDLIVTHEILAEAGLGDTLQLIIQPGEIRILSKDTVAAEQVVEDLAGCLGQEPATAYDFHLKIGGLYEAR